MERPAKRWRNRPWRCRSPSLTQEWLDLLRDLAIPAARLRSTDELFDDPQLNAIGFFEVVETGNGPVRFPGVPTWFSRTPGRVAGAAPTTTVAPSMAA